MNTVLTLLMNQYFPFVSEFFAIVMYFLSHTILETLPSLHIRITGWAPPPHNSSEWSYIF